jgi:hypothetical protein
MKIRARLLAVFCSLALLALPCALWSKPGGGRVTGKVTTPDGEGLLGAIITLFREDYRGGVISFTRSDRHGAYVLANLTPGSYQLQVSREGYQPITRSDVEITPGKTTNLDVVLQQFLDLIADDDPRNWDFNTVLRTISSRRLIFRHLEGGNEVSPAADSHLGESNGFVRSATVNVASSAGLSSENYSVFPSEGRNGIVSNFAFAEPVGEQGRVIFSGQVNSGYDSFWRIRNTYNYRPEAGRDYKLSLAYGRLSSNGPSMSSLGRPTQFFSGDSTYLRDSGVQTVGLGFEASANILDPIRAEYGFDLSRISYGETKSVFSPFFQLTVTPADTWAIRAALASRRVSDNNSVLLPDGELVSVMEPTYIAQLDGELYVSRYQHQEISVAKTLPDQTMVEFAIYEDRMDGPGTPFLVRSVSKKNEQTKLAQLTEDQSDQHGMRVAINRSILDFLRGSIAYVYGTGTAVSAPDDAVTNDLLARNLLNHIQKSYYHSFTSQLDAVFPRTRTQLTTIVRWYPGTTLSPIDVFSDRKDSASKGMSFFIRQAIPLPEFIGTAGRWEALVDVRNLLDQGRDRLPTTDGELILTRNPRSVRFGLNLNLF